ncbi:MAG: HlyD family efflux transporter periplasmic adaptor subunit [Rivularia sp. (in: Bacteria)]|nr:HlyD family efflux transporter periplasmic adaptor subunit [Rivularia sp. MS3]
MVNNTDFLPTVQTSEFLPPISRWTTWGGLFILSVVGLTVPVAAVTQYKTTVRGQAVIRPVGELRIVQGLAEGQIVHIFVKQNQVVKKGDAIATIDDSRLQTKKSQLQTNIQETKLQLVQINAQIHALNNQIKAETDRINRNITTAKAELNARRREYRDKQITTAAEVQEADAHIKMAQEELKTARVELKSVQANLHATEAALGVAASKKNRYESVAQKGALSKNQLEEVQLATEQQQQAVKAQQAAVEMHKAKIERLQQAVSAAIARKKRVQTALNPSNAAVEIALQHIAREKAAGESNMATLEKELQALIKQRIEIEKQLERHQRELQQVQIELNQTTITATADGIISQLNLRNPGQTLRLGEEVAQIVPTHAPKVVKASVASEDKSKLQIDQKVQMRVNACPFPDYGILNGKVQAISPDAVAPQKNRINASIPNTNAFYEVTIKPEKMVLGKGKNQCPIQLGMEVRADIITREETVMQFLLRKARLVVDF